MIAICGPISILSMSGKGKPFTFSPLIGFLINGDLGLMTPQSQHLVWPYVHRLNYVEAVYNFLINGWYLCMTGMLDMCQGTHLSP